MNKVVLKRHEKSYEKLVEIVCYKNNGKSFREIENFGPLKECNFRFIQKVLQIKTAKNQLSAGRPEKFMKVLHGHVTFPVIEPLI